MIVHEHCETAGSHAVRKHGIGPRGWPNNPGPADTAPYDLVEHVVGSLLQRRSGDWLKGCLIDQEMDVVSISSTNFRGYAPCILMFMAFQYPVLLMSDEFCFTPWRGHLLLAVAAR